MGLFQHLFQVTRGFTGLSALEKCCQMIVNLGAKGGNWNEDARP